MKLKDWAAFIVLGVIWGSSFLWIKLALQEIGPFLLVAMRLLWALIGLVVVVALRRPVLPRDRSTWLKIALLGVTNTALPFLLITWGEKFIDSGVASILNGTVPLFTLIIAHLFLQDERMTVNRVVGLVGGFIGIVILMGRDVGEASFRSSLLGQLAVIAAAGLYASSSVFTRRQLSEVPPMIQSIGSVFVANMLLWLTTPIVETPVILPHLPLTWIALAWLGVMGTCVAYLLFFYLIQSVGATRTTLVTYVIPVFGVLLGVIVLNEQLDWHLALGTALVVAGIWVVNTNWQIRLPAPDKTRA